MLKARPLLFTILGEVVYNRGGEIALAMLYRLMAEFDFSPGAVRLAILRMARQGWLVKHRRGRNSFYALTPLGVRQTEEGIKRIYKLRPEPWDGQWRLLAYSVPESRKPLRDRLRKEILWLGYGALSNSVWICPHDRTPYVRDVLRDLGLEGNVRFFTARYDGPGRDQEIIRSCWDLESVAEKYRSFIDTFAPRLADARRQIEGGGGMPDHACFRERILLVHAYRRFIFIDPGLPEDLCPPHWPGSEATRLFHAGYTLLAPGTRRFLAGLMGEPPPGRHPPLDPFETVLKR